MKLIYHVKFTKSYNAERWVSDSFEKFWHDLREFILRNNPGELEWIIRD